MNHNTLERFGGWALLLLAATQGLLLGLRPWPGSVASDPWVTAGNRLIHSGSFGFATAAPGGLGPKRLAFSPA
jgi:hypothetical protein